MAIAPAPEPVEVPELKEYELSKDEQASLDAFAKDWPDIATAQTILQRQASHNLEVRVTHAMAAVLQKIYEDLAPVMQTHVSLESKGHFDAIRAAYPDYDSVVGELPKWIETQPSYLRAALQKVYDAGNAQEVIELVGHYKASTGRVTPQMSSPPPAVPPTPVQVDPAKVAALAPVTAKRSTPDTKGVDPNDFAAGFDAAQGR